MRQNAVRWAGVVLFALALGARATTLTWDADGVSGGTTGGTGTWNTASALWDNAGTMTTWNNATPDSAIFGGTAGTVTLGSAITAGSITFNTAGYLLDTGANALTATTLAGSGNFTKIGTGTLTLSGSSSYSGALTIRDGIVQLNSGASLSSGTGITIEGGAGTVGGTGYPFKGITRGGTLYLRDDTGSPGSNQLGSQTVTLKNGTILWYSGGGADTTTISTISLDSGFNTIAAGSSGNPDVLKITNLNRTAGATVEFRAAYIALGTGEAQIRPTNLNGSAIANTNGILGGWAFVAQDTTGENALQARHFAAWNASATIGSEVGSIVAATPDKANGTSGGTSNSQDIASAASTENWLINDSSTRNIIGAGGTTTVTINSLIEQADLKINNGSTLVVASGGVIFRNNNFWLQTTAGSTGYLTSGTNDLYLQTDGGNVAGGTDQYIKEIIKDGPAGAVTLRKSGSGLVKLNQFQTYTGGTFVNQGTLQNNAATAYTVSTMGTGGITINGGGTLQANGVHQFGWNAGTWNNFTINDGGTFAIGANDNYIGSLTLNDNASITGTGYVGLSTGSISYTGSVASKQATIASKLALASPQGNVNATFTVNGTNPAGDLVVNGAVQGGGNLTKAGTGILALSGVNTYTGNTTISAGTLLISGSGQLNSGAYAGTISNSGTLTYSSSATQTLSGKISGAGVLKVTSGTLTLSNTGNDYNGATTVNGGTLNVTGVTASGSAVALNGGTLKGTGTVGGTVTVATDGAITGGDGTTGTLAIGNLTYNGNGTINIGTLSNYTSSSAVSVTGTLTLNGNTITLNLPTGSASAGTFHLLGTTYNSLTGIALGTAPTLSSRQSGGLAATASFIDYVITGVNPYWTGAQSSEWSTATIAGSKNWELPGGGGTTDYLAGDIVLFDDSATGLTVDIATDVSPGAVTFNNTSKNYTLTGAAGIAGTTGLTKSGTGTLTISAANSYTGATSISGGVVNIQSAGALGGTGSGTTVASGAALEIQGGITVGAEALSLNGTGISSGGALRNISGSNTYGGAVTLAGASRINSDAGTLTLTGGIANGGFGLTVGGAGDTTVSTGVISGGGSLTKDGNGTLTLSANNTYTGGTTVNGGTLAVTGAQTATGTITVGTGTLTVAGNWKNAGNVAINNGGTLTITSGGLYKNSDGTDIYTTGYAVTVYTGGTLNLKTWGYGQDGGLGGASDYSAQRVMDGGTINITGNSNPTDRSSDFRVTANGGSFNMLTAGQTTTIENNPSDNIRVGGALTFGGAGNITINEVIVDNTTAGSVTKTGAGVLTLSGANTYTGTTTPSAGTLKLSNQNALAGSTLSYSSAATLIFDSAVAANAFSLGGLAGSTSIPLVNSATTAIALSVGGNGTANTYSGVLSGAGSLKMAGAGTLTLTNGNTYTGGTTISAGRLAIGVTDAIPSGSDITMTGGELAGAGGGTYILTPSSITVSGTSRIGTDTSLVIAGTGGITSSATTLYMCGTHTYSGTTAISGTGYLEVSHGALSIANSVLDVTSSNGARAVDIWSGKLTVRGLTGTGIIVANGASGNAFTGTALEIATPTAESNTFNGVLKNSSWSSGVMAIAKSGDGTQILAGANTYTGATTVNGGALRITGSLANTAITINGGALWVDSTGVVAGGATVNANGLLRVEAGGSMAGNVTINQDGLMRANGSSAGVVTVNTGGTLMGTGTVGGLAVEGGTVAPGSSIGLLKVTSDVTFNTNSLYEYQIDTDNLVNGDGGLGGDLLVSGNDVWLNGTVELKLKDVAVSPQRITNPGGVTLTLIASTAFTYGVFQYNGSDILDNTPFDITLNGNPYQATVLYNTATPGSNFQTESAGLNYVTMTIVAIPEPGTLGILGACLAVSFLRRRR